VDRQVHEALLPPPIAEQGLQPDEAAVRQHPRPEREPAVVVEEARREVGIVVDEAVAEAGQVDQQEGRQDEEQPDGLLPGEARGHRKAIVFRRGSALGLPL